MQDKEIVQKRVVAQSRTKTQGRVWQLENGDHALKTEEIIGADRYFCWTNCAAVTACDLVLELNHIPNAATFVNEGQPYNHNENQNQNHNQNQNQNQNQNENDFIKQDDDDDAEEDAGAREDR